MTIRTGDPSPYELYWNEEFSLYEFRDDIYTCQEVCFEGDFFISGTISAGGGFIYEGKGIFMADRIFSRSLIRIKCESMICTCIVGDRDILFCCKEVYARDGVFSGGNIRATGDIICKTDICAAGNIEAKNINAKKIIPYYKIQTDNILVKNKKEKKND